MSQYREMEFDKLWVNVELLKLPITQRNWFLYICSTVGLTDAKNSIKSHTRVPRKKTCSLTDLVGYCEGRTPWAFLPKLGPSADQKDCGHPQLLSPFFIKTSELYNAQHSAEDFTDHCFWKKIMPDYRRRKNPPAKNPVVGTMPTRDQWFWQNFIR